MPQRVLAYAALVVFLAACSGGDKQGVSAPFFPGIGTDQSVSVNGLNDRVEVLHDDQGVPHIYATNERDAMFVQGYVTARDRFLQMEVIRKAASGRVAELFGLGFPDETLEADLETRRINMTARGTMIFDELIDALEPNEQARLFGYTAGINAWINDAKAGRNGQAAPVEYDENPFLSAQSVKFADTAVWTVADSFAIGRFQQWNLSGSLGDELKGGRLRNKFTPEFYAETQRYEPVVKTLTIDDFFNQEPHFSGLSLTGGFGLLPLTKLDEASAAEKRAFAEQLGETLRNLRNPGRSFDGSSIAGSNNWVVGPEKSESGHALLANDPHLTILNPPLFYNTHLNTSRFGKGRWDAIGVTFPGIPGLLIGHNQKVAWGVTTLGYDVMDLYREKLVDGDAVEFKGESVPVEYSVQTFQFGTGEKARTEEIRMPYVPHHGAVVSGEEALEGGDADLVTMKWTGRELTADYRAFFDLLSAKNVDDFFAAVHSFDIGAQSFVGADTEGNIGYFGHALVPDRNWDLESAPPDAPLPGTGEYEWDGYLPDGKLVQEKNPEKGYIATANNDIVGTNFDNNPFNDDEYYWHWQAVGFRIGRISELIEEKAPLTLDEMAEIQNDTFSLEGQRAVPLLLASLDATSATMSQAVSDAVDALRNWDYSTPTGVNDPIRDTEPTAVEKQMAVATSIYYIFQDIFKKKILEDEYAEYDEGAPGGSGGTRFMFYALENTGGTNGTDHWFDIVSTPAVKESPADLIILAMEETLERLEEIFETSDQTKWLWGDFHKVEGREVLALLTGFSNDSNGPVANDGAQFTVDVASNNSEGLQHSGAQVRFVAEMIPGAIESHSVIPGGQVANPDSPHKADQWDEWVRNERLPFRFYDADVEGNVESKWVFLPK